MRRELTYATVCSDVECISAKQSKTIPSSWIVGWGYNLKESIGGIEP